MNVSHLIGNTNPNNPPWAYAFQDVADFAFYPEGDPFNHIMDYVVSFGNPSPSASIAQCILMSQNEMYTVRYPLNTSECQTKLDNSEWDQCFEVLDDTKSSAAVSNFVQFEGNTMDSFSADLPFQACGYEFNPNEFKTCRPLTMINMMSSSSTRPCYKESFSDPELNENGNYHYFDMTQIDDFPTSSPTSAPSNAPTGTPTEIPTQSPSMEPTLGPTASPTTPAPTVSPTQTTASPTAKPTNLPTANRTVYDSPDCVGMTVMYLDELFPDAQSSEQFNQQYTNESEAQVYNSRRVWSNGVLDMYFTDRFEDGGVC